MPAQISLALRTDQASAPERKPQRDDFRVLRLVSSCFDSLCAMAGKKGEGEARVDKTRALILLGRALLSVSLIRFRSEAQSKH